MAGFAFDGAACRVGSVALRFEPSDGQAGINSWALHGLPADDVPSVIDGLPTAIDRVAVPPSDEARCHPNGVVAIDHLVVTSPRLDRTVDALGQHGFEPRRTRDTDNGLRQVFFRMGEVILELVGSSSPRKDDGPARFYGLAFTSADLDGTAALLGERLGPITEAVQPGRRIATVRRHAGLGTAVAIMSEPASDP